MTAMLARLSRSAEVELTTPLYPNGNALVWVAREPALSSLDAVTAAIESLASAEVHDRLPTPEERAELAGVVVMAKSTGVAGFTGPEIHEARTAKDRTLSVLWLVGAVDAPTNHGDLHPTAYPVTLDAIASFVARLDQAGTMSRAA